MRFTVYAFSTIPDLETARRNFDLPDLSDKDVAKVLFHQRKQQTGHSEALNWDQLQIASISMVHCSTDGVSLESLGQPEYEEPQMIGAFFQALERTGHLVSWGGETHWLPLLDFRCMKNGISDNGYWRARNSDPQQHIDIQALMAPAGIEIPPLDGLARRFDYPGMLGVTGDKVWDAHLAGQFDLSTTYSDYQALNAFLLALRVLALRGKLNASDVERAHNQLREHLNVSSASRCHKDFLENWGNAE